MIRPTPRFDDAQRMGDGKTFEQALRALDKLIAEQTRASESHPPEPEPVRRAYQQIVVSAAVVKR